jgi:hypothetical protein
MTKNKEKKEDAQRRHNLEVVADTALVDKHPTSVFTKIRVVVAKGKKGTTQYVSLPTSITTQEGWPFQEGDIVEVAFDAASGIVTLMAFQPVEEKEGEGEEEMKEKEKV